MVIDATITKSNIHTTIERAEGLKHDLQTKAEQHSRLKLVCKCRLKTSQAEWIFLDRRYRFLTKSLLKGWEILKDILSRTMKALINNYK